MRLTNKEIQIIRQVAQQVYGEKVEVYLFGSRTDDSKRGGDIDLLIRSHSDHRNVLSRVRMAAQLKLQLGDQKIDIVGDYEDSSVVQDALKTGIRLL